MFPATDPLLVFTILALAMLAAPLLAGRLRIPDLVLLLGFGALLGPHGLHVLERNESVTVLGAVGLIYIMFLAGLEIDLYRFSRSYRRSVVFGLLTFAIPQTLGTLAGRWILRLDWQASILLASMFASHTLLAYPIASGLGIARREPVAITVGATIITDILALLVLAVIADSARGVALTPVFWATIVLGLAALFLLVWKAVPFAARWFFQHATEQGNAQFLFVLATVCIAGYLSHFAKMEPIIGAFLAGAAFNRLIPENSPLMSRVVFAGNTLFIPFFLISVGMLVDPAALLTGTRSWIVGGTMVAAVAVTKYAAAWISRIAFGYSRDAGHVMFGLSIVQAAATLAAVVVGYNLGVFDAAVLNGAILMILVTCPFGSWVVDRCGRRMALEEPAKEAASGGGTEQRILVPVANPDTAIPLLDLAFLLRNAARPGGIYPLAIVRDGEEADSAAAEAEKLLGFCLAHAASADLDVEPELRMAPNEKDCIVQVARERRAGTVLVGWSGKATGSVRIFGSVMHHLVGTCPAQLLFCRLAGPLNTTRRVLVPFPPLATRRPRVSDFAQDAKRLAQHAGAELRIYAGSPGEAERLLEIFGKAKPDCSTEVVENASWRAARETLFGEIGLHDLILLPLDRRNGLSWTPELDRLPELVADRFPRNSLLAAYPALPGLVGETGDEAAERDTGCPRLVGYDLAEGATLEDALRHFTETAFPGRPLEARTALADLLASAATYPVELAPGTVLLHARSGHPEEPMLLVCHAPGGWPFPSLPQPPTVILVLLGSSDGQPEEHLRALSAVARRLHAAAGKPGFGNVQSASAVCAALET